jgi:hypothetical protein
MQGHLLSISVQESVYSYNAATCSFEVSAHTNTVTNLFSCHPISYTTFSTYDLFSNLLLLSISYSAALFFLLATSGLTFFCPYPIFIIQPSTPPVVRLQM